MRRKSIGATSQAFHEPMSSGALLEFLTPGCRAQGLVGQVFSGARRSGCNAGAKRNPASVLRPVRVAGSRPQGPVGQVSRRLGARAPRAWGPAHQGPGAFSPQKPTQLSNTIFRKPPGGSLAKAWVSAETAALEGGTWRETKPGYPPYPPPPPPPPHFGAVREKGRNPKTLNPKTLNP